MQLILIFILHFLENQPCHGQERIMKKRRGGGNEREALTHLIENLKLSHAGLVIILY